MSDRNTQLTPKRRRDWAALTQPLNSQEILTSNNFLSQLKNNDCLIAGLQVMLAVCRSNIPAQARWLAERSALNA